MQTQNEKQNSDRENLCKLQKLVTEEYSKRLETIETFILQRKKNPANAPTVIDLCNERISEIDLKVSNGFNESDIKIEMLKSQDFLVAERLNKIDEIISHA